MTHAKLIERLEKADGADRELDSLVARSFGASVRVTTRLGDRHQVWWPGDEDVGDNELLPDLPEYTTSIDAALSLVERVLPGWDWLVERYGLNKATHNATLLGPMVEGGMQPAFSGNHHQSPAIALLIALLKAVEEKE